MKSSKNKLICVILSVCISLTMLPTPGFVKASDEHWSKNAVDTLNSIYESDIFSTSDSVITNSAMKSFLDEINWSTVLSLKEEGNLTRAEACEILAEVFKLPTGEKDAIEYLYEKKIINGYAEGGLGENISVTHAQFATLAYRVLRMTGFSLSTGNQLKPGTDEYFSYHYLKVRGLEVSLTENIFGNRWNNWNDKLKNINFEGKNGDFSCDYPGSETTQLDAAKIIVEAYINYGGAKNIFRDVNSSQPWYDGIMYLYDKGILKGYEDASFRPGEIVSREVLSVLISRIANTDNGEIERSKQFAIDKGYMLPDEEDANWWTNNATREEAIVAIMKVCNVDVSNVNPLVLERFKDKDEFPKDISPYVIYSVMLGIVKGTADGYLSPGGTVNRGGLGLLLYRTLIGVDSTKMQDYQETVNNILGAN